MVVPASPVDAVTGVRTSSPTGIAIDEAGVVFVASQGCVHVYSR